MTRTPKGRALGNALRQSREDKQLTLRAFAAQLDRDPGVLSRWENGERTARPEQVAQILTALGIYGDRYEEVVALAYDANASNWVATSPPSQRQQLAALVDLEHNATRITQVSPLLIPGLLQTSEYARAVMIGGGVPTDEVEERVAVRLRRQDVLNRHQPADLLALIGQAALLSMVGGRDVMVGQLRSLLESGKSGNIEIRVIGLHSGFSPALEGPFMLIESSSGRPVVHVERRIPTVFLHESQDCDIARDAVDAVCRLAMSPGDSAKLIADVASRLDCTR